MLRSSQHFVFDLTTKWHLNRPEPTHLFQSFSSAHRVLSDFPRGVVATSHLLGRGVLHPYIPTFHFAVAIYLFGVECASPIRAMEQVMGIEPTSSAYLPILRGVLLPPVLNSLERNYKFYL